jgi:hypothetical protein
MENAGKIYGNLVYFVAIWYILSSFGIFFGRLVHCVAIWYRYLTDIWCILWPFGIFYIWFFGTIFTEKNLATLLGSEQTLAKVVSEKIELVLNKIHEFAPAAWGILFRNRSPGFESRQGIRFF